jgi:hypothetical protein
MEKFTAVIKNIHSSDKSRSVKVTAWDQWEAHKFATDKYHQYREDIVSIRDSKNNEVYDLEKGFIFES